MIDGPVIAPGSVLVDVGALDESAVGPLVTALTGLSGQLLPPVVVSFVGLAGVRIAGRCDRQDGERKDEFDGAKEGLHRRKLVQWNRGDQDRRDGTICHRRIGASRFQVTDFAMMASQRTQ